MDPLLLCATRANFTIPPAHARVINTLVTSFPVPASFSSIAPGGGREVDPGNTVQNMAKIFGDRMLKLSFVFRTVGDIFLRLLDLETVTTARKPMYQGLNVRNGKDTIFTLFFNLFTFNSFTTRRFFLFDKHRRFETKL